MAKPTSFLSAVAAENFEPGYATSFLSGPPAIGMRTSKLFPSLLESTTVFTPAASGIVYSSNVSPQVVSYPPPDLEKELQFEVSLSLRVESEKLLSWQVDEVKLLEPTE